MRRAAPLAVAVLVLALLALVAWEAWPRSVPPPASAEAPAPRRHPTATSALRTALGARPLPAPAPAPAADDQEAKRAAVYGRVRGAEKLPEGAVVLEGCGINPFDGTPVDADGGFFAEIDAGRCTLRAWRMQGALRLPGPWVEVDAAAGGDVDVEVEVPAFEPAGMGITFAANDEGVLVLGARPGSPSADAGFAHGDKILLIDGEPTQGMSQEDFLHYGIGPAGSSVHLEGISADGEPFDVTLTRKPIPLD